VDSSSQLACDFRADCLWTNTPSDGLLDSSDFFLMAKSDRKAFPIQVGPGNAHPAQGECGISKSISAVFLIEENDFFANIHLMFLIPMF
jgi:hypothetical protein